MGAGFLLFVVMGVVGLGIMGAVVVPLRRSHADLDQFLGEVPIGELQTELSEPFTTRVFGRFARLVVGSLERFLPSRYLEKIDLQLAQAGMLGKRRASEHLAIQVGLGAAGAVVMFLMLPGAGSTTTTLALMLLPVIGFMVPAARLKRKVQARADAIFKDLPDIVDMLAIAVEAGSGFESALSTVCANFESPLTDELSIALREMELGLTRKAALQQLRERTTVDAVRNLILALLQADALGIPIGRVLKTQATEVRARRRAWAREKAAKLPVKILFPLVLFIFPPVLALVLGPAAGSFTKLGGG